MSILWTNIEILRAIWKPLELDIVQIVDVCSRDPALIVQQLYQNTEQSSVTRYSIMSEAGQAASESVYPGLGWASLVAVWAGRQRVCGQCGVLIFKYSMLRSGQKVRVQTFQVRIYIL
jgi:hypothetical protein